MAEEKNRCKEKPETCCLLDMPEGSRGRICVLMGDGGMCQRLREIGFCEQMEVCKLRKGSHMLCWVGGAKIAVAKEFGECVYVEECECVG